MLKKGKQMKSFSILDFGFSIQSKSKNSLCSLCPLWLKFRVSQ